ncbi:hypothetical protein LTR62_008812 [Meristemomyces frigidus]|uniref:Enolase-phosphatase E1 n=1 Tax=Meristemomyces frigidus TaxID=1508187 RepID=A0AAN7YLP0_9PEZI|nr:hypothetical protein LTR62_008812 [Meristemomyces frigidus]
MPRYENVRNVLLDIEGTICPISFVKETLFPYALRALPAVLTTKWDDRDFIPYRDAFPPSHRSSPQALQAHVEDLTKRDIKIAYLKNLQGYLWEEGYRSGSYATPLFPDVVPRLKLWRERGVRLGVYSSGSVAAQRLLFGYVASADGEDDGLDGRAGQGERPAGKEDFRYLIVEKGWFDTTNAGLKTEVESYVKIVQTLDWKAEQTLFLTDNILEYDAATAAGLQALLVIRPGNATLSDTEKARLVGRTVYGLGQIGIVVSGEHGQ